jgi:uncharacterized repeat protein (TIGR03803 family)
MRKCNWGMRACIVILLWATSAIALPAQTFTTLHSFDKKDGQDPYATLVQGINGDLYGTTHGGGVNGGGTVFKITPGGTLTTLYSFCSESGCTDGADPEAALVLGTDGDFYGTTSQYGAIGAGTVFKITPSGTLTTLHSFNGDTDGYVSFAALIQGTDGNFYGTTYQGGAYNYGTVFKITPSGTLTALHSFNDNGSDGAYPYAGLVDGTDGSMYGTTARGGAKNEGTVFKITPRGTLTRLYSFCEKSDCKDGSFPLAGLAHGTDGYFYGTTFYGGAGSGVHGSCPGGCGTAFKITSNGRLTKLHNFSKAFGANARAGLVLGTDDNFYGTTVNGGMNSGRGTVFQITPTGTLTTLFTFHKSDGAFPYAGLVQDTNGTIYGTTYMGGVGDYGTVFSLSVGLGPFVVTEPTSGTVGAAVNILGTDLTDATSVTFNGTTAMFTVKSKSEITTTVPASATTGKVRVTFPRGTRSSNVPFRVE